ncbi:hypothetical protein [Sphingobacterium sp. DR205]|uniref:hypothetical protein n=1 Tax=Sphingobacterium sp. DR205 TaxID=2713573 RepID=UPI0013E470B2|nr:hypothetical protein [Sphingobacterium sp. DR205]QIH32931.1 hypothetical protein G6053_08515 [Sphingobacterium sp. DR205]
MNLSPIKARRSFLLFVSLFFSTISAAQILVQEHGTIPGTDSSSAHIDSNSSRELKKAAFRLVPSSYLVQYAGSIGLFSAGAGWDYGRQKQWSTDFLLGYVPKYDTDRAKLTLTLRQTYTPFTVKLHEQVSYHPLRTGVYLNTTLGKQFWYKEPDKYPNSYYSFSTRLRINIFVGQDFSYKLKSNSSYFEGIKFYYDLHTSDLYLVSGVQNKYLKFDDYIGLALGIKLQIRRK